MYQQSFRMTRKIDGKDHIYDNQSIKKHRRSGINLSGDAFAIVTYQSE